MDDKLEWTFQLYDVNNDGFITKEEMTEVITAVYELMGKISEGCKEENQIKAKVESMFKVNTRNCLFCFVLLCFISYVFFLPSASFTSCGRRVSFLFIL